MNDFFQLGVRDTERLAPDRRDTSDGGILQGVAQCVPADHPARTNDGQVRFGWQGHESAPSSIQSTKSLRSAKSHSPSVFANVSS